MKYGQMIKIGLVSVLALGIGIGGAYGLNTLISGQSQSGQPDMTQNANSTQSSVEYSGDTTITEDGSFSSKTYASTTADENALIVSGAKVSISDSTINKTGDSSSNGDSANFYGTNSGILAKDGATLTLTGLTVTTDANGANGVFSYGGNGATNGADGDGTTVNISDSTITTKGDSSGGIMTTGGGITNATNLNILTYGTSSAAIRTDRGGGAVNVNKGTYKTEGVGSPAIYSTADITVKNATLMTTKSEAVVIEGMNSVTLKNCKVTGNNSQKNGQSTTYDNVKIYQSMSGDSAEGTSTFTMTGGSLVCKNGNQFHVTNTSSIINLEDVDITNSDTNVFLDISADAWGNSGSNGGTVTLNTTNQDFKGLINVDSISSLTMNLKDNSNYKGAITNKEAKEVNVTIDSTSTWTLTEDSYVTSLTCKGKINLNGHKLYVNGKLYKG